MAEHLAIACRVMPLQMLLSWHGPWSKLVPSFCTAHYLHMTDAFCRERQCQKKTSDQGEGHVLEIG